MRLLNEKEKKMMVEVRVKNDALCSRLTRDEKGKLTKAKDSLIFFIQRLFKMLKRVA